MQPNSGILKWIPPKFHAYARLARIDKPIGIWLLLLPCYWGLALTSSHLPLPEILLFTIGAVLMRSVGCIYNDWVDRDFDSKVRRTANRPLASKALSVYQAYRFMVLLLGLAFLVLLSFSFEVILLGGLSLILVVLYPWMKRFTYWPQAFLGLTFNWGILMGSLVGGGRLDLKTFLLYGAGIFWTLGYDTIYAFQDRDDDALIGVKSTALKFSRHPKLFLMVVYGAFWFLLLILGWISEFHQAYILGISLVGVHLFWQGVTLNPEKSEDCLKKFKSNTLTGLLVILALLLGRL
ncbi:4-hydroxybenzoate octaprenyltransferase [Candidatus Nucleicultrix amoebiphila]|jgi:4-hydroxybenzoate polyprenyltransferase|uniref:4-hydroxybenzoate octaprenyltransferase n=1 Tax=Candidatus Nucleicultrix amoebiphila FS5 TaxID=1414854 RepID=A0A1W6N342_9PROT|nr:4-hydroxybenzoate octaprenyltransferase [Candidatus Nucleicultrix amoebiphila]ARN84294.1 hypothetical protein GQ61_01910 [Candidatus Nucleicultrix amoebiphila FS5]